MSNASRDRDRIISWLISAFATQTAVNITRVSSSGEATSVARAAAEVADTVIAVGGDGTVADVVTGIVGSGAALGIVPAGSTNITARGLGIPASPSRAVQLLSGPHRLHAVDVGHCGGRCFLHMAGAGFDAELFKAVSPALKRSLRWFAYLQAAVPALRTRPSSVRVTIDGQVVETMSPLILVANGAAIISPTFEIYPDIANDDGFLDVLIFTAVTPAQVAATLGRLAARTLDRSPYVLRQRGNNVHIQADPPFAMQMDGDVRGETPATVTLIHGGLNVVHPLPNLVDW